MKNTNDSHFLNLDVEITSKESLAPLVDFFGDRVFVLCNQFIEADCYSLVLETSSFKLKRTPERYIKFFLTLFETIPKDLQRIWKHRSSLSFDIGVRPGVIPPPYPVVEGRRIDVYFTSVSTKTLRKVADLKGSINLTVYPYDPEPNPLSKCQKMK